MLCVDHLGTFMGCLLLELKGATFDMEERENKKLLFWLSWQCLALLEDASIGYALTLLLSSFCIFSLYSSYWVYFYLAGMLDRWMYRLLEVLMKPNARSVLRWIWRFPWNFAIRNFSCSMDSGVLMKFSFLAIPTTKAHDTPGRMTLDHFELVSPFVFIFFNVMSTI